MSYSVPESVKCLEGVDYEVVKRNAHFEWVSDFENTINQLCLEVFETIGVNDENALKIAVDGLDAYQDNINHLMDTLVKQIADKADVNESAKKFAGYWAEACRYQTTVKYHRMGDGPTAQKIRFGFQSAIKYIIICATHLADMDDGVEFKKLVSGYVKNSIIQSLIDQLQDVKERIEALRNSS